MDSLIITIYDRPESALRCLRSIATCNLRDVRVIVSEDIRPRSNVVEMAQAIAEARSFLSFEHHQVMGVNTWDNIRHALSAASDARLVMFVEDDYIVEPGFVDWHRAVHRQFHPLISNADVAYTPRSQNPAEVAISNSHCMVHAGAISGETARTILSVAWDKHFEEVIQNRLIEHRELAVLAMMPRAHDTGMAGVNLGRMERTVELRNPPTLETFLVGRDLTSRWEKDFQSCRAR
jgi:hypothetical protein